MSYMDKKTFKSQEICNIIKVCGAHNVESFELEDLKIKFYIEGKEKPTPVVSEQIPIVQDQATKDSIKKAEEDYITDREMEFKAEELATLHIKDPTKFEELLANPELIQEFSEEIEQRVMGEHNDL